MIDKKRIEHIIENGVRAPSGDNSQPWTFRIQENEVTIMVHPDEDHPLLNIEGRGTYIATGALIENMCIAAEEDGLHASVEYGAGPKMTARMSFREQSDRGHRLHHTIAKRHTHRGPYDLNRTHSLDTIIRIREPHCRVRVITEPNSIKAIAEASSAMEEAALSTRKLHELFFDSILWSEDEHLKGAPGLHLKTTELPPPVQGLFRLIRYWPAQSLLNRIGFPKMAAKANAAVYAQSFAIVAIILDRFEVADVIAAGRCMQRAWLEATDLELAAQPLAGLLYLAEYLERTSDPDFSHSISERVEQSRATIERVVGTAHGSIAMLLRLGAPLRPASARAARRAPRYT